MTASIRARCSRPDTYRAAPAARMSSIATSACGTAIPPSVAISADTKSTSSSVEPLAQHRRVMGPRKERPGRRQATAGPTLRAGLKACATGLAPALLLIRAVRLHGRDRDVILQLEEVL